MKKVMPLNLAKGLVVLLGCIQISSKVNCEISVDREITSGISYQTVYVVEPITETNNSAIITTVSRENLIETKPEEHYEEPKIEDVEFQYLAQCVMAEAGNQDEIGKRLVIDCILNRVDSLQYPNTITDVINQEGQFAVVTNKSIFYYTPTYDIYILILQELEIRYNYDVLNFRTQHYHDFGTPLFKWGDHYFSM